MKTQVLPLDASSLATAGELIRAGQLVAFPTETVYGLGANALDVAAVGRIFDAKGRPQDNPLIVHIWDVMQAGDLCHWTEAAQTLADAFWPGPLTMLLKKKAVVPDVVTAGLDTVGIRLPGHEGARAFLRAADRPIAGPSANRSGRPSPTTAAHVLDDMDGRIPLILDGGSAQVGLESTVLDMSGDIPCVLRPGAVTPEAIAMVLGHCDVSDSVMRPLKQGEAAPSPGMRHRHYAPKAPMTLFAGSREAVADAIRARYDATAGARILAMEQNLSLYGSRRVDNLGPDAASAAQRLFHLLRQYDEDGVSHIYCESLPATGLGLAVMNRLARAAEFDLVNLG